jgi:hypothetical protein
VRLLSPSELEQRIRHEDPLPGLTRQIVVLAGIAWSKHHKLQVSVVMSGAGALSLGVASLLDALR